MADAPKVKGFWNSLGAIFGKLAVWAAEHPEVIQAVVNAAVQAKK